MAITKTEVWKELRPKLPNYLDEDERTELMEEIGDFVVTSMLDMIADGHSPVYGAGNFKNLTDKYANAEKGGDLTANMDLEGDLLNSITFEADAYSVKIGTWDKDQAIKAYGHITGFKGHKWLDGKVAPRKLIPNTKESFNSEIQSGIDQIIEEFLSAREDSEAASGA
jgi:phage gpG-like protein